LALFIYQQHHWLTVYYFTFAGKLLRFIFTQQRFRAERLMNTSTAASPDPL
jgi:hypothetical protein